jgi:putative transcriptional regulator
MIKKTYQGQLLAAHPGNPKDGDHTAVVLVITNKDNITVGLQVNQTMENPPLSTICHNIGIDYEGLDPLYFGGQISQNKIHVVHSLDWQGLTTVKINSEIGVTNDISILAAISRGEGPEYFRACVGYWLWEHGRFEQQINPKEYPSKEIHRWESVPATIENLFSTTDEEQWRSILEASARQQVANWF